MIFKLPYYVSNGGDGSANLRLMPSLKEAEGADEAQDEVWGESSAGEIELKVDNGKLFYRDFQEVKGKYTEVWVEVGA